MGSNPTQDLANIAQNAAAVTSAAPAVATLNGLTTQALLDQSVPAVTTPVVPVPATPTTPVVASTGTTPVPAKPVTPVVPITPVTPSPSDVTASDMVSYLPTYTQ